MSDHCLSQTLPAKSASDRLTVLTALWRQFLPLSVSDVTMAASDPLITTTLAHLPAPTPNIAAMGIAKALVIFFESPIIMILHASNTLAPSSSARRALRHFVIIACGILTLCLSMLIIPPVFTWVTGRLIGVGSEIQDLVREALLWLLLWPAFIGWRRYYQGILIRQGHAKAVARAGLLRLGVVMTMLAIGYWQKWLGVRLAGIAMICGVFSEALAVTVAAKIVGVQQLDKLVADKHLPKDLASVWRFYWPLANSMLVVWGGRALLVAIVARAVDANLALAAWPAAWGLSLVIANATRMVQQVTIKNRGQVSQGLLLGFALSVGAGFSLLLVLIGASPLGRIIVDAFVGQNAELAANVQPVVLWCGVVPLLIAVQNGVQGLLIADGRTARVNLATWIGTASLILVSMALVTWGLPGALAAAAAMVTALAIETMCLARGIKF